MRVLAVTPAMMGLAIAFSPTISRAQQDDAAVVDVCLTNACSATSADVRSADPRLELAKSIDDLARQMGPCCGADPEPIRALLKAQLANVPDANARRIAAEIINQSPHFIRAVSRQGEWRIIMQAPDGRTVSLAPDLSAGEYNGPIDAEGRPPPAF